MEKKKTALELKSISKSFPGVKALDDVSFAVEEGSVHILVGENGAGKSTLIKIINGMYTADQGELYVFGEKITTHNPRYMKEIGIATIHQELNPVPDLTIAENIFLGRIPTRGPRTVDKKRMVKEAQKLIDELGFHYDARRIMRSLTVSDMQIMEIIKAISVNARVIIMDEPTSSITESEVAVLHEQIHKLKKMGISIIYISHKLEEIKQVGDRVTVIRDGKVISSHGVDELTTEEIITKMVGRRMDNVYPVKNTGIGEKLFEVKNFTRHKAFQNVSFTLHRGEILGMAGLVGAGRTEVVRAIFGLDPHETGEVYIDGRQVRIKKVSDAIKEGIIMLSEDRKLEGLVLIRSIAENIGLPNLKRYSGFLLNKKLERKDAEEMKKKLAIKTPTIHTEAQSLSGGNQQKVVIAKWLLQNPLVFIMDEPTRGIDVGAKYEIYKIMCDLAAQGAGVIMISSELPEIIGVCDRTLVMAEGRITGEVARVDFSQERIMSFALGGAAVHGKE
ncbi:sugar ABC transporter ATP-binding protein [Lawsonibacter sp. OA9]|uniref:sugar ABC transporter ATP-binding protein n=1 Tax=Oscillospiraceae TaxID=216572 RepID=UPI001F066D63|nr:sugar ABC transporter ATP-binding protein [Lawsonibacter sp. OA9]MCH1980887.1 sugar ABC transporter ATP-binding protein [Lawsonibacter sp. OA9]MCH1982375.1 sugar ABC transporter ATP-binding protein [Ruminococcus sp. OA3]